MNSIKEINNGWNLQNSYTILPNTFFTMQNPKSVKNPKLVILNESLGGMLGLDINYLKSNDAIKIFAGNEAPKGAMPLAQAYAGHQFGYFTMLGDGRAILLGEQATPTGKLFDIQLKGSGRTSYSRGGDGRAALGPMLREYIISEAMYALGIPTTRSLAVVTTGEDIIRERRLKGAILTRVASSHIRVGTFEYAARFCDTQELKALADYTLDRHYPCYKNHENKYLYLLEKVIENQAELVAKWQLVGFIHGVMNTDNMTISGETIDYGPCAFMDDYKLSTVFSSIDTHGRYAYGNQPYMALWNIARLGEALLPLLHENQEEAIKLAENEIEKFYKLHEKHWLKGMRAKLGMTKEEENDKEFINSLLSMMEKYSADYTNTFLYLTFNKLENHELFKTEEFKEWHLKWRERTERECKSEEEIRTLMKNSNPAVIPRNHRVEEALQAAEEGNYDVMNKLLDVISKPYAHLKEQEEYSKVPKTTDTPYKTYCGT